MTSGELKCQVAIIDYKRSGLLKFIEGKVVVWQKSERKINGYPQCGLAVNGEAVLVFSARFVFVSTGIDNNFIADFYECRYLNFSTVGQASRLHNFT